MKHQGWLRWLYTHVHVLSVTGFANFYMVNMCVFADSATMKMFFVTSVPFTTVTTRPEPSHSHLLSHSTSPSSVLALLLRDTISSLRPAARRGWEERAWGLHSYSSWAPAVTSDWPLQLPQGPSAQPHRRHQWVTLLLQVCSFSFLDPVCWVKSVGDFV